MTFAQFALKNLFRRPVRTVLTGMGIGLGIGAVVALIGLAWGMKQSWGEGLRARKTDLVVRKSGGGLSAQPFDETVIAKVREFAEVDSAAGMLGEFTSVEEVPLLMISGREWGTYVWDSLHLVSGEMPKAGTENVAVLGTIAAENLNKKAGDTLTIDTTELKVVGIVDGKAVVENGSIFVSLPVLQQVMNKQGRVNYINIRVKPGVTDFKALAHRMAEKLPGLRVDIAEEVFSKNEGMQTFEAMNWGTSAVAILVGMFGVMNTMLMSVFERTREIGILMALGWKRSRILRMILFESVALCGVAGLLGVLGGIALVKGLAMTPWMYGRLEPHVGWDLSLMTLGVAVLVGICSGLYSALHCTKINPSMAIREG